LFNFWLIRLTRLLCHVSHANFYFYFLTKYLHSFSCEPSPTTLVSSTSFTLERDNLKSILNQNHHLNRPFSYSFIYISSCYIYFSFVIHCFSMMLFCYSTFAIIMEVRLYTIMHSMNIVRHVKSFNFEILPIVYQNSKFFIHKESKNSIKLLMIYQFCSYGVKIALYLIKWQIPSFQGFITWSMIFLVVRELGVQKQRGIYLRHFQTEEAKNNWA